MDRSRPPIEIGALAERLTVVARFLLRYGLVVLIVWFGAFKFTETEAKAIEPLISNSPFLSWLYDLTGSRQVSRLIGGSEILIASLIALRPLSAFLSALGSLGAVGMFLTTLSFLVTTPGMWIWIEGFPLPSQAGAFIVKDVFLLGAALLTGAEALASSRILSNLTAARLSERTMLRLRAGVRV